MNTLISIISTSKVDLNQIEIPEITDPTFRVVKMLVSEDTNFNLDYPIPEIVQRFIVIGKGAFELMVQPIVSKIARYTGKTYNSYIGKQVLDNIYVVADTRYLQKYPQHKRWYDRQLSLAFSVKPKTEYKAWLVSDKPSKPYEVDFNALLPLMGANVLAVDTETTGFDFINDKLLGISLSSDGLNGYYIPVGLCDTLIKEIVLSAKLVVGQNFKFDAKFLLQIGLDVDSVNYSDTMLVHYSIDENDEHGLKALSANFTDIGEYESELEDFKLAYIKANKIKKTEFSYASIPIEVMYKYAALDAVATFNLRLALSKEVTTHGYFSPAYKFLIPASKMLTDVELRGIPIDLDRAKFAKGILENRIINLRKKFNIPEDLNLGSVVQMRKYLFEDLGLPKSGKLTPKGEPSTDVEVIDHILSLYPDKLELKAIGEIKTCEKILSTYLNKFITGTDTDGRLRTGFNLTSTTSGRLSSSGKLNAQQLIADGYGAAIVKGCIKPIGGKKIVSQDLVNAEMFLAAFYSNDPTLVNGFINGDDFHGALAVKAFNLPCTPNECKSKFPKERRIAKTLAFALLYGGTEHAISTTLGIPLEEAIVLIEKFYGGLPKLKEFIEGLKERIARDGFLLGPSGRVRHLLNVFSTDSYVAESEVRSGVNAYIQSAASDINLKAAIDIYKTESILMLVHDSIVVETNDVDSSIANLRNAAQADNGFYKAAMPIGVDVEVGDDYSFGKWDKVDFEALSEGILEVEV